MKLDTHSLPDDPEQLKRILLELQQRMVEELAEKRCANSRIAASLSLQRETCQRICQEIRKNAGAGEVFNEA